MVRIARAAGLVAMGTLAIDGSKLKANASKHKAMSYGRMQEEDARLRREIEQITQRAQAIDAAEDTEFGPDVRGDELPAELQRRETRRAKIREAMERTEARRLQPHFIASFFLAAFRQLGGTIREREPRRAARDCRSGLCEAPAAPSPCRPRPDSICFQIQTPSRSARRARGS